MNRDSDEQRAVSQTLCGALQKEANCKCLVLSMLIYGCLAAVTWCRCANVTKVVINFDNYPLKRTEHVSPCDEGYIYIPVAFMGMLYLVYLVECYHSPIRIDLFHADSQDNVMTKLSQLRLAQPTIWWKAVSYHYVRRKRQITRYRNGDNYTTTQVYYERANTHAATSFYFYEYCGVKDISKDLTMDTKIPITKITLTKGFAFSNMRSATEFEEARSRFFAEQELRDDYMEMREGLDLGYNFNPTTVVGILGKPWFTNSYVYWCLSALLLSWPLRIIIEYNTQYADYQVTKLFGVNYDTPTSGDQIHASSSQLSAPGSYMLAPSYSEALLMEPSPITTNSHTTHQQSACQAINSSIDDSNNDIVPSYSEALLYERAAQQQASSSSSAVISATMTHDREISRICDCHCHIRLCQKSTNSTLTNDDESQCQAENATTSLSASCREFREIDYDSSCSRCRENYENLEITGERHQDSRRNDERYDRMENSWSCFTMREQRNSACRRITRDLSAPNFLTNCEFAQASSGQFSGMRGNSLENILENEETGDGSSETNSMIISIDTGKKMTINEIEKRTIGCGTIPKKKSIAASPLSSSLMGIDCGTSRGYRLIENPMINDDEEETRYETIERKIPISKTYLCLKSLLKQHRRRHTLVTAEELQKFASDERLERDSVLNEKTPKLTRDNRRAQHQFGRDNFFWRNSRETIGGQSTSISNEHQKIQRVSSSRSLIFPSPIEESCRKMPNDPFGGKAVHVLPSAAHCSIDKPIDNEEITLGLPRFAKIAKSLTSIQHKSITIDSSQRTRTNRPRNINTDLDRRHHYHHHRRNLSIEPEYLLAACRRKAKIDMNDEETSTNDCAGEIVGGSSIDTAMTRETIDKPSSIMPAQIIRKLRRGMSLNDDDKTDRNERKKFLRASLAETSTDDAASSFFFFDNEENRDDANSSKAKRYNVSIETSL